MFASFESPEKKVVSTLLLINSDVNGRNVANMHQLESTVVCRDLAVGYQPSLFRFRHESLLRKWYFTPPDINVVIFQNPLIGILSVLSKERKKKRPAEAI